METPIITHRAGKRREEKKEKIFKLKKNTDIFNFRSFCESIPFHSVNKALNAQLSSHQEDS